VSAASSLSIYEYSGPRYTFTLAPTNAKLQVNINPETTSNYDEWMSGTKELYDFYLSDAYGNLDYSGSYLTIDCRRNTAYKNINVGGNIDAVALVVGGQTYYADCISRLVLGTGLSGSYSGGYAERALGAPDAQMTFLGDGWNSITLGFTNALR